MAVGTVFVMYPRKDGSTFNKDYYLTSHMELCKKHWTKHGFKSWSVTEPNADSPYICISVLEFETPEGFGNAAQDSTIKEIMEDVKNYYTEPPVIAHGPVVGRG
ncbi:uncharacterized protein SETTUDRAFT_39497 [Exserohilum turcica Et28A]|uniref:EthD domain-containing protein n=1 Tax=Exserohilum turcicum (strain 28A) TaxID=671987 RepID=R0INL2_EXST2|nr:uncharacterized protein SETTUDRAFT_39497 [Exserohilum turcica Et28A]EOA86361.1 hypothetical protein SETTUDRAFT_39497 [Exserohilum turcica Et28A]